MGVSFPLGRKQPGCIEMAVYGKYVLPRLIDLAMKNKDATRLRAAWIPHARGKVLEVGIGSGLNFPYYSREVQHVYGVDPSPELQQMARRRVISGLPAVEFLSQSAEDPLPLADSSVDTVVLTWTLCSIPNAPRALEEMKRVLGAEGRLIFIEHGRAPDATVRTWQDRLTPLWKRITGGCHLNRKIDDLVTEAGFQITELTKSYLPGPRPMTYTYQGFAQVK
jgi:ubiquinone/menaquinone biosynthesis C-methylase UbiE